MVSLTRMLKSLGQAPQMDNRNDETLPSIHYPSVSGHEPEADNTQASNKGAGHTNTGSHQTAQHQHSDTAEGNTDERSNQQLRAKRVVEAVAQVNNTGSPTPLTDQYLAQKKSYRHPNRPPFDPASLWQLKHGKIPIMTELVNVVDVATLNSMPIEAVAILDRINDKLKRYREWSDELNGEQQQWVCERQYVIDKLVEESIPEALKHYEQLLRFSPHRTKNNLVNNNMTAGDILTDLFLEIDYELDELLDELHHIVLNKLASTHRYVKSRTQNQQNQ